MLCNEFIKSRVGTPIAQVYSADGTPMRGRDHCMFRCGNYGVVRAPRVTNEWLGQEVFYFDPHGKSCYLLTDMVPIRLFIKQPAAAECLAMLVKGQGTGNVPTSISLCASVPGTPSMFGLEASCQTCLLVVLMALKKTFLDLHPEHIICATASQVHSQSPIRPCVQVMRLDDRETTNTSRLTQSKRNYVQVKTSKGNPHKN